MGSGGPCSALAACPRALREGGTGDPNLRSGLSQTLFYESHPAEGGFFVSPGAELPALLARSSPGLAGSVPERAGEACHPGRKYSKNPTFLVI